MRIGVTGATGFLGSHLCERLLADGHDLVALRRRAATAALPGMEIVVGDVTDPAAVGELVRRCDAVFHAAACIGYGPAFAREHERVNVGGTRVVASACRRAAIGRLVHVSSVAAIGVPDDGRPADETAPFNLERFSYHLSKSRAEAAVLDETDQGLDAVIVNPSSILGPHGAAFRGAEVPRGVRRRRIVPYFVGGANVVHVEDVVDAMLAALRVGACGERYILGGENLTWLRMAQIAADEMGVRRLYVPVIPAVTAVAAHGGAVGRRLGRSPRFTLERHQLASRRLYYDSAKARSELRHAPRAYAAIVREYLERVG